MSGCVEFGTCEVCKKEDVHLIRTYFRYNIKCECHSPYHFELVCHCPNCTPTEPNITKITLRTDYLKNIEQEIRKEKIKNISKKL